jgi:hypothetical protein
MKGIIFNQFLDMVEGKFGYQMVDAIILQNSSTTGGAYTSIGNYSHDELKRLFKSLHEKTKIPLPLLLHEFGRHLFQWFIKNYGSKFQSSNNAFCFIKGMEVQLQNELEKIYPDIRFPEIKIKSRNGSSLEVYYYADYGAASLIRGILEAALDYFDENAIVKSSRVPGEKNCMKFTLYKKKILETA